MSNGTGTRLCMAWQLPVAHLPRQVLVVPPARLFFGDGRGEAHGGKVLRDIAVQPGIPAVAVRGRPGCASVIVRALLRLWTNAGHMP